MTTTAYAGLDGHLNFNIPKVKRKLTKDNLTRLDVNSRDAKEILSNVERSYLGVSYPGSWKLDSVDIVVNKQLEEAYRGKKQELKEEGRHSKDIIDQYNFLVVKDPFLAFSIARSGLQVKEKRDKILNALGNSKGGVSLWKHADVQLSFAETYPLITICKLIVFKVILGKVKSVQPCYGTDTMIEPTPNYDCHICAVPAKAGDPFYPKLMRSQVFFYEYTDEALPASCPRQCLPYAILTYKRPKECAPVDHLMAKSAYSSFFKSLKINKESSGATDEVSCHANAVPGRSSYRAGSRQSSVESDPRLNTAPIPPSRTRSQPLLPDPPTCVDYHVAPLPNSSETWTADYAAVSTGASAPYKRPLLQTPDMPPFITNLPQQRIYEDPRIARRKSLNSCVSWTEQPYYETEGESTIVIQSPPVSAGVGMDTSQYPGIPGTQPCQPDIITLPTLTNGYPSADSLSSLNSTPCSVSSGAAENSPAQTVTVPSSTVQHVDVSKVQQCLTVSQMAMLKQALSTSQVVSPSHVIDTSPTISSAAVALQSPAANPLIKPRGKQKLSLESYRQLKRRQSGNTISENQNVSQTVSAEQTSAQEQAHVILIKHEGHSDGTKNDVIVSENLRDEASLHPPQVEFSSNPAPVKGILKTSTMSLPDPTQDVDQTGQDNNKDKDIIMSDLGMCDLQSPVSPGSVVSSTSLGSMETLSHSSSLAGSTAHSPAQAESKPNVPQKKKKKINRMMMGYKKRRKRKGYKAKGAASKNCKSLVEEDVPGQFLELSEDPLCDNTVTPKSSQRTNPLWNLASPPSEIDYNDFSVELQPFFEMPIPDANLELTPPSTAPMLKRQGLSLEEFGIHHWSQALTDHRFQPVIKLYSIKMEEEPVCHSVSEDNDEILESINVPDVEEDTAETISDKPTGMELQSESDLHKKLPEIPLETNDVPVETTDMSVDDPIQRELPLSFESEDNIESDSCKNLPETSYEKVSENKTVVSSATVSNSDVCDITEIDDVIDRHMKQSHYEDLYPMPYPVEPSADRVPAPKPVSNTPDQMVFDGLNGLSMETIHRVAANILPYMNGNSSDPTSSMTIKDISSTIAAILAPAPEFHPVSTAPQTSVSEPVDESVFQPSCAQVSVPSPALENSHRSASPPPQPGRDQSAALAILHDDSDEEYVFGADSCASPSPIKDPETEPVSKDALYSAYSPYHAALTTATESAEQTAAKWLGQMAQLCNPKKGDPEKPTLGLFESVRQSLNLDLALEPASVVEDVAELDDGQAELVSGDSNIAESTESKQDIKEIPLTDSKPEINSDHAGEKVAVNEVESKEIPLKTDERKEIPVKTTEIKEIPVTAVESKTASSLSVEISKIVDNDKFIPVLSGRKVISRQSSSHSERQVEEAAVIMSPTPTEETVSLSPVNTIITETNDKPHVREQNTHSPEEIHKGSSEVSADSSGQKDILTWFEDMIGPKHNDKPLLTRQFSGNKKLNSAGISNTNGDSLKPCVQTAGKLKDKESTSKTSSCARSRDKDNREKSLSPSQENCSKRRRRLDSRSPPGSPYHRSRRSLSRRSSSYERRYKRRHSRDTYSSSHSSSPASERERVRRHGSRSRSPRWSGRRRTRDTRSRSYSPRQKNYRYRQSPSTSPRRHSRHRHSRDSRSFSKSPSRSKVYHQSTSRYYFGLDSRSRSSSLSSSSSSSSDTDRTRTPRSPVCYKRSSYSPKGYSRSRSPPVRGRSPSLRHRSPLSPRHGSGRGDTRRSSHSSSSKSERRRYSSDRRSSCRSSRKSSGSPSKPSQNRSKGPKSDSHSPLGQAKEERHNSKHSISVSPRPNSEKECPKKFRSSVHLHKESMDKPRGKCVKEKDTAVASVIKVEESSNSRTAGTCIGKQNPMEKVEDVSIIVKESCAVEKDRLSEISHGAMKATGGPKKTVMNKIAKSEISAEGGSPVRRFEKKTLDDLASERARLLSELDDLKNSDSDTASAVSLYSKASDVSLKRNKSCIDDSSAINIKGKKVEDSDQEKYSTGLFNSYKPDLKADTPLGFFIDKGCKEIVDPAQDTSSQVVWNNKSSDFTSMQRFPSESITPPKRIAAAWSSILCNIKHEKTEVIRSNSSGNVSKNTPDLGEIESTAAEETDVFELECKAALQQMEKVKRQQQGHEVQNLHFSPLHTWLTKYFSVTSSVYEDILKEICEKNDIVESVKYSAMKKTKRKSVRKMAERLRQLIETMKGSDYCNITVPVVDSANFRSPQTISDWLASFLNSDTKYFKALVEDVTVTTGVQQIYKMSSMSHGTCAQLRKRAQFCCRLLEKITSENKQVSNGEAVKKTDSDTNHVTASKGHETDKAFNIEQSINNASSETGYIQCGKRCLSCGRYPHVLALSTAIENLKQIRLILDKSSSYFKEYVSHMNVVLWNGKAFKTFQFKLDKCQRLLQSINSMRESIRKHFCDLTEVFGNVANVIKVSKRLNFKQRKVQIQIVISYLNTALKLVTSSLEQAEGRQKPVQIPGIISAENYTSCEECYQYIHSSSEQPKASSNFISFHSHQSSDNSVITPSAPRSVPSTVELYEENLPSPVASPLKGPVPPPVLTVFKQLQKVITSKYHCKWPGTTAYEKITGRLLLADEVKHGVVYGGRSIWLRRTLSKSVYYQLIHLKKEINQINKHLHQPKRTRQYLLLQEKAKVSALNKRWNLIEKFTSKLTQVIPKVLRERQNLLKECALWHRSGNQKNIEMYKTESMLNMIELHIHRIGELIPLAEVSLDKMRIKKRVSVNEVQGQSGYGISPVGTASEPCVCDSGSGSARLEPDIDLRNKSDTDLRSLSDTALYNKSFSSNMASAMEDATSSPSGRLPKDEASVWTKAVGPDPVDIKVTYFTSRNTVLPPDCLLEQGKIEPRNDDTRRALAAALVLEQPTDQRPMYLSSPSNLDTRRALAGSVDQRNEDKIPPQQDVDMRWSGDQFLEVAPVRESTDRAFDQWSGDADDWYGTTKADGEGYHHWADDQNEWQGKAISSTGDYSYRQTHYPYKQHSPQYRSPAVLRDCCDNTRYPDNCAVREETLYYDDQLYDNSYPPQPGSGNSVPDYGMAGSLSFNGYIDFEDDGGTEDTELDLDILQDDTTDSDGNISDPILSSDTKLVKHPGHHRVVICDEELSPPAVSDGDVTSEDQTARVPSISAIDSSEDKLSALSKKCSEISKFQHVSQEADVKLHLIDVHMEDSEFEEEPNFYSFEENEHTTASSEQSDPSGPVDTLEQEAKLDFNLETEMTYFQKGKAKEQSAMDSHISTQHVDLGGVKTEIQSSKCDHIDEQNTSLQTTGSQADSKHPGLLSGTKHSHQSTGVQSNSSVNAEQELTECRQQPLKECTVDLLEPPADISRDLTTKPGGSELEELDQESCVNTCMMKWEYQLNKSDSATEENDDVLQNTTVIAAQNQVSPKEQVPSSDSKDSQTFTVVQVSGDSVKHEQKLSESDEQQSLCAIQCASSQKENGIRGENQHLKGEVSDTESSKTGINDSTLTAQTKDKSSHVKQRTTTQSRVKDKRKVPVVISPRKCWNTKRLPGGKNLKRKISQWDDRNFSVFHAPPPNNGNFISQCRSENGNFMAQDGSHWGNGPYSGNLMDRNGPYSGNLMDWDGPYSGNLMDQNGPYSGNLMGQNGPQPGNFMGQQGPRQRNIMGQNGPHPGNLMGQNGPHPANLMGQDVQHPGNFMGQNGPHLGNMDPNGPHLVNFMAQDGSHWGNLDQNGPYSGNLMDRNGPYSGNLMDWNGPYSGNLMDQNGPQPGNFMGQQGPRQRNIMGQNGPHQGNIIRMNRPGNFMRQNIALPRGFMGWPPCGPNQWNLLGQSGLFPGNQSLQPCNFNSRPRGKGNIPWNRNFRNFSPSPMTNIRNRAPLISNNFQGIRNTQLVNIQRNFVENGNIRTSAYNMEPTWNPYFGNS